MTLSVDTRLRRGGEVNIQLFEVDADGSEEMGDRILTFAFQMEFDHGEQSLDGRLVDDPVLILRHDGVG